VLIVVIVVVDVVVVVVVVIVVVTVGVAAAVAVVVVVVVVVFVVVVLLLLLLFYLLLDVDVAVAVAVAVLVLVVVVVVAVAVLSVVFVVFPDRSSYTLLLDGESIMHTAEAKASLKANHIRLLPSWPPHSPDLNPQEHVWGWAEDRLRKTEKQTYAVSTFKMRVHAVCKQYTGGAKLVPGLAKRMAKCLQRKGAPIGE
jgi:hypothetical protein